MRRLSLTLGALATLLLFVACTSSDATGNDASREASIRGIMMQNAAANTGAIRFGGD